MKTHLLYTAATWNCKGITTILCPPPRRRNDCRQNHCSRRDIGPKIHAKTFTAAARLRRPGRAIPPQKNLTFSRRKSPRETEQKDTPSARRPAPRKKITTSKPRKPTTAHQRQRARPLRTRKKKPREARAVDLERPDPFQSLISLRRKPFETQDRGMRLFLLFNLQTTKHKSGVILIPYRWLGRKSSRKNNFASSPRASSPARPAGMRKKT